MFRLVRYFSIASLVVFFSLFLVIFFRARSNDIRDLVELREQNNTALTQAYANTIWETHAEFIVAAATMTAEEIMAAPEFEALDADVRRLTAGSTIIKVKIYAPNGITVYSSEFSQIGQDKTGGAGFEAAMDGGVSSELVYKDTFNAFEGTIQDLDIVETYVPVQSSGTEIDGVVELYDDVTVLMTRIDERQTVLGFGLAALLGIGYIVLFFIVRYAESVMRKQHSQIESNVKELGKANEQLMLANSRAEEATRLKSEFLSTMSHELRTPLNAIIGYSGIITTGISDDVDDKTMRMVQRMHDSGQHLLMLINNVLDISKIEAGRMTIVKDKSHVRDISDALTEQLQVLADKKNLDFVVTVADSVPEYLMLDSERLKQIYINLLSNAIKFTETGSVKLDMTWENNELRTKVTDTGVGIPPHSLDYIFDEFRQVDGSSTRHYEGTGLGLAIVRKFAEAMGGKVSVESTVGKGTQFIVNIPAELAETQVPQKA